MKSWPAPASAVLPKSQYEVKIFDSVSKSLISSPAETATLYVCGITPYDATHIGHASTYIAFDILNRVWQDSGLQVKYAQNITDVDDPLLERAAATQADWQSLALTEIDLFRSDMTALRVLPPDFYVSVTEHMQSIIDWISKLVDSNLAYQVEGDWYFDTKTDAAAIDKMQSLVADPFQVFAQRGGDPERVGKKNPFDPLLWRSRREGEPSWEAPFGAGRPGWHIECLAIARDMLGNEITVQGGGEDLVFPHHYMCELQGRAANSALFAKAHVHAGLVAYQGEKMSKSRGNLVFVSKLLEQGIDPMAIRLAVLRHHYRDSWEWTAELLLSADSDLQRYRQALSGIGSANATELLNEIRGHLANDLDTPNALKVVDRFMERTLAGDRSDANGPGLAARTLDKLLGLSL